MKNFYKTALLGAIISIGANVKAMEPEQCQKAGSPESNNTLTSLDLSKNKIGDKEACKLANSLMTNNTLTSLDLDTNSIGDEGATSLAEALKVNSPLRYLYLPKNCISDKGFIDLAEALETNSKLDTLYLGFNSKINDDKYSTSHAISRMLTINSSLRVLNLEVPISEAGILRILSALKNNKTLQFIWLWVESETYRIPNSCYELARELVRSRNNELYITII